MFIWKVSVKVMSIKISENKLLTIIDRTLPEISNKMEGSSRRGVSSYCG